MLREIAVVANDLALSSDRPALMLTGPNAGGKTVALKTLGLCAMLVQIGCWVPADEGSRVDYFDGVFASIGDAQSVAEDLSSFSGHLAVLRELVTHAGPGHLALLDEIAVGTDPAQGAALAQAVIEQLVERGSRLVITTHFGRLKSLAVLDPRFTAAAVEYREGRPTYRLVSGSTGESHALSIARTMGIDPTILARAEHLIGQGERAFAQATEALEVEVGRHSPAAGRTLRELHLPHEMIVGGVIRGNEVFVPRGETEIHFADRLIVIALPKAIPAVEQLSG